MYINSDYDIDDLVAYLDVPCSCIRLGIVVGLRVEKNGDPGADAPKKRTVYVVLPLTGETAILRPIPVDKDCILKSLSEYEASCNEFERLAAAIGHKTPRAIKDAERAQARLQAELENIEATEDLEDLSDDTPA